MKKFFSFIVSTLLLIFGVYMIVGFSSKKSSESENTEGYSLLRDYSHQSCFDKQASYNTYLKDYYTRCFFHMSHESEVADYAKYLDDNETTSYILPAEQADYIGIARYYADTIGGYSCDFPKFSKEKFENFSNSSIYAFFNDGGYGFVIFFIYDNGGGDNSYVSYSTEDYGRTWTEGADFFLPSSLEKPYITVNYYQDDVSSYPTGEMFSDFSVAILGLDERSIEYCAFISRDHALTFDWSWDEDWGH